MVIEQRGIYWTDFGDAQGHAQSGLRPVLVMQTNLLNRRLSTVMVIPLTSNLKNKGLITTSFILDETSSLGKDSVALLNQFRTINIRRLREKCGELNEMDFSILRTRFMRLIY